jgi:hypothetical protein
LPIPDKYSLELLRKVVIFHSAWQAFDAPRGTSDCTQLAARKRQDVAIVVFMLKCNYLNGFKAIQAMGHGSALSASPASLKTAAFILETQR